MTPPLFTGSEGNLFLSPLFIYNPGCSSTVQISLRTPAVSTSSSQSFFVLHRTISRRRRSTPRPHPWTMALRPRASSQPGKLLFFQSPKAATAPAAVLTRPRAVSSRSGSSMLEEELSCPICCEIFRDPVVLKCSHSFCRACLQQFWNKKKARRECPVCRRKCSLTEPTVSLALKNVADTFLKDQENGTGAAGAPAAGARRGSGPPPELAAVMCATHGEVLKLFCLDDLEALCCVCHTSKRHQGHRVCPLEEGAQDLKVTRSPLFPPFIYLFIFFRQILPRAAARESRNL